MKRLHCWTHLYPGDTEIQIFEAYRGERPWMFDLIGKERISLKEIRQICGKNATDIMMSDISERSVGIIILMPDGRMKTRNGWIDAES